MKWGAAERAACTAPCLGALANHLDLHLPAQAMVWQTLALGEHHDGAGVGSGNNAFHSIGALGVIELTAPGRAAQLEVGLRRLGVAAEVTALLLAACGAGCETFRGLDCRSPSCR